MPGSATQTFSYGLVTTSLTSEALVIGKTSIPWGDIVAGGLSVARRSYVHVAATKGQPS